MAVPPAADATTIFELAPPVCVGESVPLNTDFQAPLPAENNYDDGALHRHQVAALQRHLDDLRRDDQRYLAEHTELKQLIGGFVAAIIDERPDDPRDFAATYFAEANRKAKQGEQETEKPMKA